MCRFVPVYLAVIPHRFYTKNTTVWIVVWDKFETFLKYLLYLAITQYIAFSWKTNEGWGNTCKYICRHKESILAGYHFFQDVSASHSKASHVFSFLSLCRKLPPKTTLMLHVAQLGNQGPDPPDHIYNWGIKLKQTMRCTCGAVSTRIFAEKLHLADVVLFSMTNIRDIQNNWK